jgi:HD-GYP domain-containing protein (c-di-GMP phosphodiesterase class II)
MPEDQVMQIMAEGCGTMFDPLVVEVMFEMLRERRILQRFLEDSGSNLALHHA